MSAAVPGPHEERLLDTSGPAAPPRANGELVFEHPWESRAFGMAMALHAAGAFAWEEFRQRLIAAIAAAEARPGEPYSYYHCWLAALEGIIAEKGLVAGPELEARATQLRHRPHGHDHPSHLPGGVR